MYSRLFSFLLIFYPVSLFSLEVERREEEPQGDNEQVQLHQPQRSWWQRVKSKVGWNELPEDREARLGRERRERLRKRNLKTNKDKARVLLRSKLLSIVNDKSDDIRNYDNAFFEELRECDGCRDAFEIKVLKLHASGKWVIQENSREMFVDYLLRSLDPVSLVGDEEKWASSAWDDSRMMSLIAGLDEALTKVASNGYSIFHGERCALFEEDKSGFSTFLDSFVDPATVAGEARFDRAVVTRINHQRASTTRSAFARCFSVVDALGTSLLAPVSFVYGIGSDIFGYEGKILKPFSFSERILDTEPSEINLGQLAQNAAILAGAAALVAAAAPIVEAVASAIAAVAPVLAKVAPAIAAAFGFLVTAAGFFAAAAGGAGLGYHLGGYMGLDDNGRFLLAALFGLVSLYGTYEFYAWLNKRRASKRNKKKIKLVGAKKQETSLSKWKHKKRSVGLLTAVAALLITGFSKKDDLEAYMLSRKLEGIPGSSRVAASYEIDKRYKRLRGEYPDESEEQMLVRLKELLKEEEPDLLSEEELEAIHLRMQQQEEEDVQE